MVHFTEMNQVPSPYSMLQDIGRVATPKLVPRSSFRYWQITMKLGEGGLVSEFMWGIADIETEFAISNIWKESLALFDRWMAAPNRCLPS